MIDPRAVVTEARSWMGTPFQHQARVKGVGVDCAGLIIGVAHALAISDFDITDYGRIPLPAEMGALLAEHLDPIGQGGLQPGDILWLVVDVDPQHLAIVTAIMPEITIIHAFAHGGINKVVEHNAGRLWLSKIAGCYRYRGVGLWQA